MDVLVQYGLKVSRKTVFKDVNPIRFFSIQASDEGHRIGLVEEVVGRGEALDRAMQLAEQVGEQSPTSVAFCKRLVHSGRDTVIAAGLQGERELFVELFSTEDQREGVNAFLEKRKPQWKNG